MWSEYVGEPDIPLHMALTKTAGDLAFTTDGIRPPLL